MIVCDVTRLFKRISSAARLTGVDRVTTEYLDWTLRNDGHACIQGGNSLYLISSRESRRVLETARRQWTENIGLPTTAGVAWRLGGILRRTASRDIGRLQEPFWLFNTAHTWLDNPWIWRCLRKYTAAKIVTFIHDVVPIEYPEFSSNQEHGRHRKRLSNALLNSHSILVNSGYTDRQVKSFATANNILPPQTIVAPLGVKLPEPDPEFITPDGCYFVVLGTIEPRKNHILLLEVWRRLSRILGRATPTLVIVGKRGWHCEHVARMLDYCEEIQPYVREVPDASDRQVAMLISTARALLFPSYSEGYGLPLVEALAMRTPVICSDLEVFHELAGDRPVYLDPMDGLGWVNVVTEACDSVERWRESRTRIISSYEAPDWDKHFDAVQSALKMNG